MTLPTAVAIRGKHLVFLSDTDEDTQIDIEIARAEQILAQFCRIPRVDATAPTLESTTYTEFLNGPSPLNPRELALDVRPLTSVTSIHDDTQWAYAAGDLVASTDYTLIKETGRIALHPDSTHGAWSTAYRALKVIYVAGFDTGAEKTIAEAIGITVAHWYALRQTHGITNATQGGQTQTYRPETIPARAKEILQLGGYVFEEVEYV